jgi:hypothetical protein
MTKFRLLLVVLCLGLLGVLPFVLSRPKPHTAQPAAQRETAVQRQLAAQRQTVAQSGTPMRAEIGAPLLRVRQLTEAGEYQQALAVLDGLEAVPDRTGYENATIGEMRRYVMVRQAQPARQ